MIQNFLNIRNSLRNLTDEEFETLLPQLAIELKESVSYYPQYSDVELKTDWGKLLHWYPMVDSISSVERIGMKLCEHFFPNFYEIEDKKGNSFTSLWTAKNLEKVLRWNRKSHSTPYLSEIKRGIYFNFGLPKSTMYRPQMAKMVVANVRGTRVLDPCAGWGGRLLGSVAAGASYVGFEPNPATYANLQRLIQFLNIEDRATVYMDSALNMNNYDIAPVDVILTSPPYFDLEVYSHDENQSIVGCNTYSVWVTQFLVPLIQLSLAKLTNTGWSCWNVHNIGKMKMINDVRRIHEDSQYFSGKIFSILSSKRQANQDVTKNLKNADTTVCFSSHDIQSPIAADFFIT